MVFGDVLKRGDDFLNQYPRRSLVWRFFSFSTSFIAVGLARLFIKSFYNVKVNNLEKFEEAKERARRENRGFMTVMNHMSTVDDPFVWATLPFRIYSKLENMRWCLGAHNICFANSRVATFFSLGQVLSTERFGVGPFQGSIDAAIRLLSPDNTVNEDVKGYLPPIIRTKPSWVHVYPEGFVLQLHPPYSNSMRYFKWGITRMILETTVPPVILPIFSTGFEKIASEDETKTSWRDLFKSFGSEINVTMGDPLDDKLIDEFRAEWNALCEKYTDKDKPNDLSDELKYGKEAQELRSRLAAVLREHVANIRHEKRSLPEEDPRFKSPSWWKKYTGSEGSSDPDIKFIGKNWAIRRLQKFLNVEEESTNKETKKDK